MANPWDAAPIIEPAPDKAASMPWANAPLVEAAHSPNVPAPRSSKDFTPQQLQAIKGTQATPVSPGNFVEQSAGEKAAHAVLQPFTGATALGEHLVAGKVGDINPQWGQAIDKAAENTYLYGQQGQGGVVPGAVQLGAGAATMLAPGGPLLAGANTLGNKIMGTQMRAEAGQQIDPVEELAKAVAAGGVEFAFNKAMQLGITAKVAEPLIQQAAALVGRPIAAVAGRALVGGAANAGNQAVQNVIGGQPVMQGVPQAAAMGGLQENVGGAIHDLTAPAETTNKLPPSAEQDQAPKLPPQSESGNKPPTSPALESTLKEQTGQNKLADLRQKLAAESAKQDQLQQRMDDILGGKANPDLLKRMREQTAGGETVAEPDVFAKMQAQRELQKPLPRTAAEAKPADVNVGTPTVDQEKEQQRPLPGALAKRPPVYEGEEVAGPLKAKEQTTESPKRPMPEAPKAANAVDHIGTAAREIDSLLGSEWGRTPEGAKVANNLRDLWGHQELAAEKLEAWHKPYAKIADEFSGERGGQFTPESLKLMEQVENGQKPDDPRFEPWAAEHRAFNQRTEQEAKAVGFDTNNYTRDYLGRVYEWPDENGKWPEDKGYNGRLAGPENYLKNRTYQGIKESAAAVEASGGRPKYNNPVKMVLAKDIEVAKSIQAHKMFQDALDQGQVHKLAPGEKVNPDRLIDDPIRWTHQDEGEGTKYAAANPEIAHLMNYQYSDAPASTLADHLVNANRYAQTVKMVMGIHHYITEGFGASAQLAGQALKDVTRSNFISAAKEAIGAIPGVSHIAPLLKNPSEEARAEMAKGGGLKQAGERSILEGPTAWEKAKKEWDSGNKIQAATHAAESFITAPKRFLFEQYIPRIRNGVQSMIMESELANAKAKGLDTNSDEFKDLVNKHMLVSSNLLGVENSNVHFQNKVAAKMAKVVFGFPNWNLGKLRITGDAVKGLTPLFKGKDMDPATYTAIGAVATTAMTGIALHALFNQGKIPDTFHDALHPPLPIKDDKGKPFRLNLESLLPWGGEIGVGEKGASQAIRNRLAPFTAFATDMATKKDWKGTPTHDTWGEIVRSLMDKLEPYGVSGATDTKKPTSIREMEAAGLPTNKEDKIPKENPSDSFWKWGDNTKGKSSRTFQGYKP